MASPHAVQILLWLEHYINPVGAEVGVFTGRTSQSLLVGRGSLTLHMVDSWAQAATGSPYNATDDFHAALTQAEQDDYYAKARAKVAFAGKRAQILRKDSVVAASTFADGSLDFVFIDADHSYEGCMRDIVAWLPKVKKGGFLSGHDYNNPDFPLFGVQRAVDEFFAGQKVELGMGTTWRVLIAK